MLKMAQRSTKIPKNARSGPSLNAIPKKILIFFLPDSESFFKNTNTNIQSEYYKTILTTSTVLELGSQLVDEDEPLFLSLLIDLFPGLILSSKTYPDLVAAISQQCDSQKLIDWPNWRLKVRTRI